MRGVYFISLLATGVFGIGYWYTNTAHICPVPILYRLGELDSRFPVSPDELKTVFAEAEGMWEEKVGQDLFRYDESADFTINFIFDERQQQASTEEEWRVKLDAEQAAYEALLGEVKELAARYESDEASYNTRREKYEADLAAYNQKVEGYNQSGGAPSDVHVGLQAEAAELGSEQRALNRLEYQLNQLADDINAAGERGNTKITAYNEEVVKYNAIFGTLETFTQGDYERTRINIYKFTTTAELTQVIAHEFGHALGIGHVEGEDSVMYYLYKDRPAEILTTADIEAFQAVCQSEQSLQSQLRHLIRTTLQKIN